MSEKKSYRELLMDDLKRIRDNERENTMTLDRRANVVYAIADSWAAALASLQAELDEWRSLVGGRDKTPEVARHMVDALSEAASTAEARLAELEAALERLAKVDPFDESELPYITASRDLQARIEFARTALDSETKTG